MKIAPAVALLAVFNFAACQNSPHPSDTHQRRFESGTESTLNPETRQYESEPPYGPRSNKPATQ